MSIKRRALTIGGTVACALGTGYFMQMGSDSAAPLHARAPGAVQQEVAAPSGVSDVDDFALFNVEQITLTSALPDRGAPSRLTEPAFEDAKGAGDAIDTIVLADTPRDPVAPKLGCDVTARAQPAAMASVELTVEAPCFGNQRAAIHHSGLVFTDVTDETGALQVTVPALSETAVFVVAFPNGKGAVTMAKVSDLDDYERVVLQWSGVDGLQIHAREFGASYGEQGHVWHAAAEGYGHVVRLGDAETFAPQLAEVYSFPLARNVQAGTIDLTVEAEVTSANCGRDISAQSLERRGASSLRTRDLILAMPDCDATGDFLVLNNLVEDLKIAAK
ncbi:hypothetical protein ACFORG_07115 [Lutimaribacter marinistellae]|uniref:Translocase n=1 Tax=Lutimaribacter marinistellae TaxID=1820329 RepID=A0ABV7TD77_9RHOB